MTPTTQRKYLLESGSTSPLSSPPPISSPSTPVALEKTAVPGPSTPPKKRPAGSAPNSGEPSKRRRAAETPAVDDRDPEVWPVLDFGGGMSPITYEKIISKRTSENASKIDALVQELREFAKYKKEKERKEEEKRKKAEEIERKEREEFSQINSELIELDRQREAQRVLDAENAAKEEAERELAAEAKASQKESNGRKEKGKGKGMGNSKGKGKQ